MAEAFRETTQWADGTKNGVYLLKGDKALAFRSYKGETTYFTKPLQIDKRGRKFEKVQNLFEIQPEKDPDVVEVAGSKGAVYYVNVRERTCTCPAAKFRKGECKHIQEVCK